MESIKTALGLDPEADEAAVAAAIDALKARIAELEAAQAEAETQKTEAEALTFAAEHESVFASKEAAAGLYRKSPELARTFVASLRPAAVAAAAEETPVTHRAQAKTPGEQTTATPEPVGRERVIASLKPSEARD
jgi:peptidoglycan hydrolase CwlO-like protein